MTDTDVGSWGKLQIGAPDFSDFESLSAWIDTFKETLTLVANLLDEILPLISEFPDPIEAATKATLAALQNLIEDFVDKAGIYLLYVPMGKRFATNASTLCDVTPDAASVMFPKDAGLNSAKLSAGQKRFLVQTNRMSGGNAGFYRLVRDSLTDVGDRNRPQFDVEHDWIAGLTMIVGTAWDPLGLLDDIWRLKGMFGDTVAGSITTELPGAPNLKVEALDKPPDIETGTKGKFTALLKWDSREFPITRIASLGDTVIGVERIAIIMVKNDISAVNSENIVQLMGTRDIKQGDTFGAATVVYEDRYNISKVSHLHTVEDIDLDDTYYFTVAYKNIAWLSDQNWTVDPGTSLGYWELSNFANVSPDPALPGSTAPDWDRTPSVGEMFPDLGYLMKVIYGWVDNMTSRIVGVSDFLSSYIEFLRNEAGRYASLARQISTQIQKILEIFTLPTATGGVYVRPFVGQGGNQFLMSDLAESLSEDYHDAPPFHNGDEYVTGFVILAGGPSEGEVRAALELFTLIFNVEDEEKVNILDDVGDAVTQLEKTCFGDDFNEIACEVEDEVTFTEAIEPLDVSRCSMPISVIDAKFRADFNLL